MAHSLHKRLPALLIAGAAASTLAAAPALATEGPHAPPPAAAPLPAAVTPLTFAPLPSSSSPVVRRKSAPLIRRARLIPRRVRRGRRPLLRVALVTPNRLRVVISRSRRAGGGRVRLARLRVPARGRTIARRLPVRARGHLLRPGRYRVRVVAIDAQGMRSFPVRLRLVVRPRR
jgi:hypothetical protein